MTFEAFRRHITALVSKAGGGLQVRFEHDDEHGKHIARFSDGTVIVGNSIAVSLEVRWGTHRAYASV